MIPHHTTENQKRCLHYSMNPQVETVDEIAYPDQRREQSKEKTTSLRLCCCSCKHDDEWDSTFISVVISFLRADVMAMSLRLA
mmetsp:Transcript_11984/g.25766  ORF Transcript_11984/g.25766 Transcript_11984/m.25766 type:complete len:83 (-) Transcript_11984:109-357(-)